MGDVHNLSPKRGGNEDLPFWKFGSDGKEDGEKSGGHTGLG